ncbi:MAG: potassium channel family protein, partial [Candidatus Dadabacteria bacterium]|nr:potassium channel family protein [Candidatus Dadabacteria bacterium]
SYTTLTTLGYGDVTALTPEGRIISVLEAIVGQLFLAFLVARLVATYTANALKKKSDL